MQEAQVVDKKNQSSICWISWNFWGGYSFHLGYRIRNDSAKRLKLHMRVLADPKRHLINVWSETMTRVIRIIRMDRTNFPIRSTFKRKNRDPNTHTHNSLTLWISSNQLSQNFYSKNLSHFRQNSRSNLWCLWTVCEQIPLKHHHTTKFG